MAKRPSLVTVMDKSGEQKTDAPQPMVAPLEEPTQSVTVQRKPGKRRQGWVQLNNYVPEELRIRAKVKALQQNRDLSDVVTELLKEWVEK